MSTLFVISRLVDAGLPDIVGGKAGEVGNAQGCFFSNTSYSNHTQVTTDSSSPKRGWCQFSASSSKSIYGNSDTVTPLSITCAFAVRY